MSQGKFTYASGRSLCWTTTADLITGIQMCTWDSMKQVVVQQMNAVKICWILCTCLFRCWLYWYSLDIASSLLYLVDIILSLHFLVHSLSLNWSHLLFYQLAITYFSQSYSHTCHRISLHLYSSGTCVGGSSNK